MIRELNSYDISIRKFKQAITIYVFPHKGLYNSILLTYLKKKKIFC